MRPRTARQWATTARRTERGMVYSDKWANVRPQSRYTPRSFGRKLCMFSQYIYCVCVGPWAARMAATQRSRIQKLRSKPTSPPPPPPPPPPTPPPPPPRRPARFAPGGGRPPPAPPSPAAAQPSAPAPAPAHNPASTTAEFDDEFDDEEVLPTIGTCKALYPFEGKSIVVNSKNQTLHRHSELCQRTLPVSFQRSVRGCRVEELDYSEWGGGCCHRKCVEEESRWSVSPGIQSWHPTLISAKCEDITKFSVLTYERFVVLVAWIHGTLLTVWGKCIEAE